MALTTTNSVTTQLGNIGNVYGLSEVKTAIDLLEAKMDQLQTLTVKTIKPTTGAQVTHGTNVAIAGIKTTATIVYACRFSANTVATGALTEDITSDVATTTAGNVAFTATDWQADETGIVIYFNHD